MPTPSPGTRRGARGGLARRDAAGAPASTAPVASSRTPSLIRGRDYARSTLNETETHLLLASRAPVLDVFALPFVQRGLWAVLLLAVPAGLLGTWIVLRGMVFYAHATGTAAFP